jgi:hypothetical protein
LSFLLLFTATVSRGLLHQFLFVADYVVDPAIVVTGGFPHRQGHHMGYFLHGGAGFQGTKEVFPYAGSRPAPDRQSKTEELISLFVENSFFFSELVDFVEFFGKLCDRTAIMSPFKGTGKMSPPMRHNTEYEEECG